MSAPQTSPSPPSPAPASAQLRSGVPGHLIDSRCDALFRRIDAPNRYVNPTPRACPNPKCEADCFEPLPFDKFLVRQNQEFDAAAARELASRPPCEPTPCSPRQPTPAALSHPDTAPQRPAASSWPHIGDVTPVPPQDPAPRLRTVYQLLPGSRAGCGVDLLL